MHTLELTDWVRMLDLHLLAEASEEVTPGTLLRRPLLRRGFRVEGQLAEFVRSLEEEAWQTRLYRANLLSEPLTIEEEAEADGSFTGLGITIPEGLVPHSPIEFKLTGLIGSGFSPAPEQLNRLRLLPLLSDLRDSDAEVWSHLEGCWIALETYLVSDATVTIKPARSLHEQSDGDAVRVPHDARVDWLSPVCFRFSGNQSTPFAFQGFEIT